MTAAGGAWPGFGLEELERWAAAEGATADEVARLAHSVAEPRRSSAWDAGQRPEFYLEGLTAKPWHDPADHAWTHELEEEWPTLRAELLAIAVRDGLSMHPESRKLASAGDWDSLELYRMGRRHARNCEACPRTDEIAARIRGSRSAGLVYFSAMRPRTHIRLHCGPHNLRIRCHLGLVVPNGCGMRVGTEARTWEEGKCLLFDDSFAHEVWNRAASSRLVFLLDVWHPELTDIEIRAICELSGLFTVPAGAAES